jgi:hypothetical protein
VKRQSTATGVESRNLWDHLEEFVRAHLQRFIHALLEEEVTRGLGRGKAVRRAAVDAPAGSRNGYGQSRKLALPWGTITVRRPRVRGLASASSVASCRCSSGARRRSASSCPGYIQAWLGARGR